MRPYELMVIVSGALDENTAHGWVNNITKSVTSVGGSVHGSPDWWGRRRLAYPIKKQNDGYYAIFNIVADGGMLDEVERTMRLSEDVVIYFKNMAEEAGVPYQSLINLYSRLLGLQTQSSNQLA